VLFGLEVFLEVAGRFHRGEGPPSRDEIARRLGVTPAEVGGLTDLLQEKGLVLVAGQEGGRLVPARSLDRISLQCLFQCLLGSSVGPAHPGRPALALYNAVTGAAGGSLADRTVLDFLKSGDGP
jgi:hypothetical protein